jgi:hypothetical protein
LENGAVGKIAATPTPAATMERLLFGLATLLVSIAPRTPSSYRRIVTDQVAKRMAKGFNPFMCDNLGTARKFRSRNSRIALTAGQLAEPNVSGTESLDRGRRMLGFGKYRYCLLVTVSAAAMMVTVKQGPLAADIVTPVAQDHWWFSIEGQYLMYDGDDPDYDISGKDLDDLGPRDGWGVGGEIGFRPADSLWSFLGRVRYGESNKEHDSVRYSNYPFYGEAEADHREEHIIADLEIGRDVGLGAMGDGSNLRLFAGVRFAHLKGKGSVSSSFDFFFGPSGSSDIDVDRKFTGIGPRIGFDAVMPLSDQFSFDLGAAGALLFGKQKFEASGSYDSNFGAGGDIDEKRSKNVVVPNLEADAALSWRMTDEAKFSLGYRVDSYFDVFDNGGVFDSRDEGDRIIHGPFIKLTISNGGDSG